MLRCCCVDASVCDQVLEWLWEGLRASGTVWVIHTSATNQKLKLCLPSVQVTRRNRNIQNGKTYDADVSSYLTDYV